MTRAVIILHRQDDRDRAALWSAKLPWGTRIEFKGPKRTLPQNDRFWAHMTDISRQARHHGLKLSPNDWKLLFMDALKQEVRMVPNLDDNGFTNLGRSSSELEVPEMADLITYVEAWCAREGIELHDPKREAAA